MSTKGLVEVENGEFGRLEIKDCGDSKEGFLLMSGASKVRPMTVADSEARSVLGPTGNKEQISSSVWKPVAKPLRKVDILPEDVSLEADNKPLPSPTAVASSSPPMHSMSVSSILRRQGSLLHSSLSLSASCSSDASSGSFHSGASMGRTYRTSSSTIPRRQLAPKPKVLVDSVSACSLDGLQPKKRCAWVTPSTDPSYGTFHDEEWGIPVHDDKEVAAAFCFYILLPKVCAPRLFAVSCFVDNLNYLQEIV